MSISYYDDKAKPQRKIALALMIINALLSFALVFYWSGLDRFIGDPYKWAMRGHISPSPSLLEYPYLALWLTPLLCMCAGWLALQGGRPKAARVIGFYPMVMMTMMLGCFYLTPIDWH